MIVEKKGGVQVAGPPRLSADGDIGRPTRWMPHPLSDQFARLYQDNTHIVAESRAEICINAARNVVASLMVQADQAEFARPFTQLGLEVPSAISQPVSVLQDQQLFVYDKTVADYVPSDLIVPNILVKHASGARDIGVVLDGPLAGVVVAPNFPEDDPRVVHGWHINRVFNDSVVEDTDGNTPYAIREEIGEIALAASIMDELSGKLVEKYYQLAKSLRGEDSEVWLSDMFFHLCNRLKLPVDTEAFQFTRDVDEI